jgi:hypothetical protein
MIHIILLKTGRHPQTQRQIVNILMVIHVSQLIPTLLRLKNWKRVIISPIHGPFLNTSGGRQKLMETPKDMFKL